MLYKLITAVLATLTMQFDDWDYPCVGRASAVPEYHVLTTPDRQVWRC